MEQQRTNTDNNYNQTMGQGMPNGMGGEPPNQNNKDKDGDGDKKKKKRFEPRPSSALSRQGRRRRKKGSGPTGLSKTPTVVPSTKCKLRLLKLDRVKGKLSSVMCLFVYESSSEYPLLSRSPMRDG